jgi:hypothetical protein
MYLMETLAMIESKTHWQRRSQCSLMTRSMSLRVKKLETLDMDLLQLLGSALRQVTMSLEAQLHRAEEEVTVGLVLEEAAVFSKVSTQIATLESQSLILILSSNNSQDAGNGEVRRAETD